MPPNSATAPWYPLAEKSEPENVALNYGFLFVVKTGQSRVGRGCIHREESQKVAARVNDRFLT